MRCTVNVRETVNAVMRDLPDGSFLVRDSLSQSAGTDKEYTLTLRCVVYLCCVQHVEILTDYSAIVIAHWTRSNPIRSDANS